jgi:glutathione S-transferase
VLVKGGRELQRHALDAWMEEGYHALLVMEKHLHDRRFFAADCCTIADIALYGHAHLARDCDFDLNAFPAVSAWLDRMREQPNHLLMDEQPVWRRDSTTGRIAMIHS